MDYEYLFTKSLFKEMKQRVKGHIYCKVMDDTLIIRISTREGIEFGYSLDNFAHRLILGLINPISVADAVTNRYRIHLLNVFMY